MNEKPSISPLVRKALALAIEFASKGNVGDCEIAHTILNTISDQYNINRGYFKVSKVFGKVYFAKYTVTEEKALQFIDAIFETKED